MVLMREYTNMGLLVAPVFSELVGSISLSAPTIFLYLNYYKIRCMMYIKDTSIPFSLAYDNFTSCYFM